MSKNKNTPTLYTILVQFMQKIKKSKKSKIKIILQKQIKLNIT